MCGIAGYLDPSQPRGELEINSMISALKHRGPDDHGVWIEQEIGLFLGHRRLSILDLSKEGWQPMHSGSGRYVIVYNGEIYNYQDIGKQLAQRGHSFRGHSDTEVILGALDEWGIQAAVSQFNGMFVFAVWDKRERSLTLARDRVGIKPLYYGWHSGCFFFASELKAFQAHSKFSPEINVNAAAQFFRYSYVPCPHSIYKSVYKLAPGTTLSLPFPELSETPGGFSPHPTADSQALAPSWYWNVRDHFEEGLNNPFLGSVEEAEEELDSLLQESVKARMISDVPLGAFLSGGIDSSTVVGVMQSISDRPVKTFSIGFHEEDYNEATHAALIAKHLQTDHTELYVTPDEAREVIPLLPTMYDEPFGDSSQIPTYLVSRLAREQVTVSLSGDGGDELFLGYPRYFWANKLWNWIGLLPRFGRRPLAGAIRTLAPPTWDRVFSSLRPLLPGSLRSLRLPGEKLYRLSQVLDVGDGAQMYRRLLSRWEGEEIVLGSAELSIPMSRVGDFPKETSYLELLSYLDLVAFLPDDILTKVDRASMAVSLEARVPLLDHRVVEFTRRLPLSMKVGGTDGKLLLRKVLERYVPRELYDRPKMGFGVPIGSWLKGPLREWCEDLLSEDHLRRQGLLNVDCLRQKWAEHLQGRRNWQYYLWDALMFQSWIAQHRD